MKNRVDILLATYNGEKYLPELIDSIINQTHDNWFLIVRDDGSKDNTIDVINKYCKKYPEKISLVIDNDKNIGVIRNFSRLINYSNSDYIMFSDQDDIWLPNKIELSLNRIIDEEDKKDKSLALLLHTDLKVVDEKLDIISDSFWKFKNLDPIRGSKLSTALCHNVVTGCTVMFNKALKENMKEIPEKTIMHDWWLNILAISVGKVIYIDTPTILYRQHSDNTLGAGLNHSLLKNLLKLVKGNTRKEYITKIQKHNLASQLQAKFLVDMYSDKIDKDKLLILKEYSNLSENSFLQRKIKINKYSFYKMGLIRNISMFFIG